MRALLLGLFALAALLVLLPHAAATETITGVTSFNGTTKVDVLVERVYTGADALWFRQMLGGNGDPARIDAAEIPDYCRWTVSNFPLDVRLDGYRSRGAPTASCSFEGMDAGTPVDSEAEVRARTVMTMNATMSEVLTMSVSSQPPITVSLQAPPGKYVEAIQGWTSFRGVADDRAVGVPEAGARGEVRFPTWGRGWSVADGQDFATTQEFPRAGEMTQMRWRHLTGHYAQIERYHADYDRDGVVTREEHAMRVESCQTEVADEPVVAGEPASFLQRSCAFEGVIGPVSYSGTVGVHRMDTFRVALPPGEFTVVTEAPFGRWTTNAPAGRVVGFLGGVQDAIQLREGATASGLITTDAATVLVGYSAAPEPTTTPAPPAEPPAPVGVGTQTVTSTIGLYDIGAATTMRWTTTYDLTEGMAREARRNWDRDADGTVSTEELATWRASWETSVPSTASWPFTFGGLRPTETRFFSVEAPALGGDASSAAPLAVIGTYEATFPATTGELVATEGPLGSRATVVAPYPQRIVPTSLRGLGEPVLSIDGSSVSGAIDMRVGFALALEAPPVAESTPSGAPAEPDSSSVTWRLVLSDEQHARLEATHEITGGIAAWSRAMADADRDGTVTPEEAEALRASLSAAAPSDLGLRVDGTAPTAAIVAGVVLSGYVGDASSSATLLSTLTYDVYFESAVAPYTLTIAPSAPLALTLSVPDGFGLVAGAGVADVTSLDGGATIDGRVGTDEARIRIEPPAAALPPPPEEVAAEAGWTPAEEALATDIAPREPSYDSPADDAGYVKPAPDGATAGGEPPAKTPATTATPDAPPSPAPTPGAPLALAVALLALVALARRRRG